MGWKTFKEHYNIKHNVHIRDNCLCIGSAYIPDIAKINLETGAIVGQVYSTSDFLRKNYPDCFSASNEERLNLIKAEDTFGDSIPVFWWDYKNDCYVHDHAEDPTWPNSTHNGKLIYENDTFDTYEKLMERMVEEFKNNVGFYQNSNEDMKTRIAENEEIIKEYKEKIKLAKQELNKNGQN